MRRDTPENQLFKVRCTGALSIVDFPGFSTLDAPDFEVWAKAINAGQFPASLVALGPRARARRPTYTPATAYSRGFFAYTCRTGRPRAR